MRIRNRYLLAAVLIVVGFSVEGCGSGGSSPPPEDPVETSLRKGDPVKGPVKNDCDNSFVLEAVNTLCDLFGAGSCANQTSTCNSYARQIYTGSTLAADGTTWNGRGGSGPLMADAALCTLRELSPKVPGGGPVRSGTSLNIGIGDVTVKQEVGYLDFDRVNARFTGYRKLSFDLPVLGKFDAITQNIDLRRTQYGGHSFNPYPFAGNHQILFGYGLNLFTEEKDKSLEIKPPAFEVVTPIGVFSAQPVFNYDSSTGVADTPFVTDRTYWLLPPDNDGDVAIRLSDLYGIIPGVDNNDAPMPSLGNYKDERSGWVSQIGLGNRGTGTDDSKVWSPPKSGPFSRPDYDPGGSLDFTSYSSRSDEENEPSVHVKASAKLKYPEDPYELVPGWVKKLSVTDVQAYIQVTPTIEAGASGQFGLVLSEGTNYSRHKEFDIWSDRLAALGIYSGVKTDASFYGSSRITVGPLPHFEATDEGTRPRS
ncbi:MAG: hypothetical protein HZA19_01920 [Nitrospirae bacterium]|nr:hypothetical protein [Nitrospirota bacterium]